MSLTLAFWLAVVFGLVMYAIMARSTPAEIDARRRAEADLLRRRRALSRERAAADRLIAAAQAKSSATPARPATTRPRAAVVRRPPGTAVRARRRKKRPFLWMFTGRR